ncbi:septation protein SepH [Actinokineospora bangkokensis]|uniref:DNA-binding protein n=1 Tax=Actinokineospora bangkokensis TaxID=1193682 RepID=A0A1Q9LCZ1_9PSEU|nr:septation protein SepH [Actinokineospora bangkokensis]OLR89882.1 DNA-binding protein [Actinokineospora bangkokensis]
MRALRVVGLSDDGKTVICEDHARGERFTLPADERLRAAARGDVTRLGQIEIELESQMRPREIQARIRAGESVEQVAEAAGVPTHKVERFAYPVLLERSRYAEMAQRAHPVREGGPDVQTLDEVVQHAFTLRGHDYAEVAEWDSWRGEDGKWVVRLSWTAGRSHNRAHWTFAPGVNGGTVTPVDEHAHDLLDPQPNRPLRTVRPVTELAQAAINLETTDVEPAAHEPYPASPVAAELPAAPVRDAEQEFVEDFELTPDPVPAAALDDTALDDTAPDDTAGPAAEQAAVVEFPDDVVHPEQAPGPQSPPSSPEGADEQEALMEEPPRKAEPAAAVRRPKSGKKARPTVPSWEDVLLGTRSNRG